MQTEMVNKLFQFRKVQLILEGLGLESDSTAFQFRKVQLIRIPGHRHDQQIGVSIPQGPINTGRR